MTGPGGELGYQLYTDASRTKVWGSTGGTDTLAGTGDGPAQSIPVYGRLESANVKAGSYTDTITATITC